MTVLQLNSQTWAAALTAGLGARTVSLDAATRCIQIAIFSAGPFRIAYPDFPVGSESYEESDLALIIEACRSNRVDLLRLHVRSINPGWKQSNLHNLGTVRIADLQNWSEDRCKKARRTKNRSVRSSLEIEPATKSDGGRLFDLYLDTIARSRGRAKYTRSYFHQIADRCCLVAKLDRKIIGFVSYGQLDGEAFYLHGGHDPQARTLYPSDLLFRQMILEVKKSGALSFDFLPSPIGKESLNRYKKAWGGERGDFFVVDFHLRKIRAEMFCIIRAIADLLHKI